MTENDNILHGKFSLQAIWAAVAITAAIFWVSSFLRRPRPILIQRTFMILDCEWVLKLIVKGVRRPIFETQDHPAVHNTLGVG